MSSHCFWPLPFTVWSPGFFIWTLYPTQQNRAPLLHPLSGRAAKIHQTPVKQVAKYARRVRSPPGSRWVCLWMLAFRQLILHFNIHRDCSGGQTWGSSALLYRAWSSLSHIYFLKGQCFLSNWVKFHTIKCQFVFRRVCWNVSQEVTKLLQSENV